MVTVCEYNGCNGCGACHDICPKAAISIQDNVKALNAVIDTEKCVHCGLCEKVCPNLRAPAFQKQMKCGQGWAADPEVRAMGSSGGIATAVSKFMIESGGVVAGCAFDGGKFKFKMISDAEDLQYLSGSKYVKSDPTGIYPEIKDHLERGIKVLFIGLPCQVAAVYNYVGEKKRENLYTIDLICHGSPSPKLLETYLRQHGIALSDLKSIQFRIKGRFQLHNGYTAIGTPRVCDRYLLSFLHGYGYTENCYRCNYARLDRVADITIGDSWGSDVGKEEFEKGCSLILCQNAKGTELIERAGIDIRDVNMQVAVENNHQLREPSRKKRGHDRFLTAVMEGKNYDNQVLQILPKECLRQEVKRLLIRLGYIGRGKA